MVGLPVALLAALGCGGYGDYGDYGGYGDYGDDGVYSKAVFTGCMMIFFQKVCLPLVVF